MNRRSFIQSSMLVSGSLYIPGFLRHIPRTTESFKKLIVIQLSGGNDGLNTWVPYRNDLYFSKRPTLAVTRDELLRLDDRVGLNPGMEGIRALYDEGLISVINQVGYPNAERSHFRAMDIWHTASDADEYWQTGWLGRYLDAECANGVPVHRVIELDDTLSLALKGETAKALSMRNPRQLYRQTQASEIQYLTAQTPPVHPELAYMYKTLTETVESAQYIHEQAQRYRARAPYPQTPFGKQLKLIAELLISGVDTQVYYVSLSGFDTHVRQKNQQKRLLEQYSKGVAALVQDLKAQGRMDETLIMTFSEFGRRVEENASGGTDHGKANAIWLIGSQLKQAGMYGGGPNLNSLDEGDLPFQVDFRELYAAVLQNWLGVTNQNLLKREFTPLPVV